MAAITLPEFVAGRPAASVDASLRQALGACDRTRECAALWFVEVQRRQLYRQLGHASLELYATQSLRFSRNRYWQFKRLADDLDRLPALKEAVIAGGLGWTKAQQVARVATEETQEAWVAKAATSSRRVLEQEVRRARKRPSPAPVTELAFQAPSEPAADLPVTVSLRMNGVQLARFEALVEKVRKLKVLPEGADRVDLLLASLECTVALASAAGEGPRAAGPAVQIVVQQCPDCANAGVVTSRGERRLAPAERIARPSRRPCAPPCLHAIGTGAPRRGAVRRAFWRFIM